MKNKKFYIWKKKRNPLFLIGSIFLGIIGTFTTYLSVKVMKFDPYMQSGFTNFEYSFGTFIGTIACVFAILLIATYFGEYKNVKVEVFQE